MKASRDTRPPGAPGSPPLVYGNPVIEEATADEPASLEEAKERIAVLAGAARKAEEELSDFVYKVSHDLRAPLRAISAYVEFLTKDWGDELDDNASHYLSRLQLNADQLSQQVVGLLELSRIGRWCEGWEPIDLARALHRVVGRFAERLDAANVTCTMADDLSETLPVIEGERRRIVQLFEILIENAIVYREPGAGGIIRLESRPSDDPNQSPAVVVRDDGIGIAPRDHGRIFRVFGRLHPKDYPGIGLGLTLARRIVECHRGRLSLESELGAGAAFVVSFGMRPAAPSGTAPADDESNET